MRKRFLFFCIVLVIFSGRAFVFGQALEFVNYSVILPDHSPAFALTGLNPGIRTDFQSPTFMTLTFPPSPKNSAAFFDLRAAASYSWSNLLTRNAKCTLGFRVISDVIPSNFDVLNGMTLFLMRENNVGGNYDLGDRRENRAELLSLRRDSVDWWTVQDKTTLERMPEQDAIALLNRLLDVGFTVEFYAEGHIQGATSFQVRTVTVQVTRVDKGKL